MTTIKTAPTLKQEVPAKINEIKKIPLALIKKRWIDDDILLNMGFRESLFLLHN